MRGRKRRKWLLSPQKAALCPSPHQTHLPGPGPGAGRGRKWWWVPWSPHPGPWAPGSTLPHRHHFRVPHTLVFCGSHLLGLRGYPTRWRCIAHAPLPSPLGILCQSAEGRRALHMTRVVTNRPGCLTPVWEAHGVLGSPALTQGLVQESLPPAQPSTLGLGFTPHFHLCQPAGSVL